MANEGGEQNQPGSTLSGDFLRTRAAQGKTPGAKVSARFDPERGGKITSASNSGDGRMDKTFTFDPTGKLSGVEVTKTRGGGYDTTKETIAVQKNSEGTTTTATVTDPGNVLAEATARMGQYARTKDITGLKVGPVAETGHHAEMTFRRKGK